MNEHPLRSEQRRDALRFALSIFAWVTCLLGWLAVVSFHPADPPSASVWPTHDTPANWCGWVGAQVSYYLFYYLGAGTFALLLVGTAAVGAFANGARLSDVWLRVIGAALVVATIATAGALFFPETARFTISGAGGVLGLVAHHWLHAYLQTAGTVVVLAAALLVGLVLVADELVLRAFRGLAGAGSRTAPRVLRGGGVAVSSVASAISSNAASLGGRLASLTRRPSPAPAGAGARDGGGTLAEVDEPRKAPRIGPADEHEEDETEPEGVSEDDAHEDDQAADDQAADEADDAATASQNEDDEDEHDLTINEVGGLAESPSAGVPQRSDAYVQQLFALKQKQAKVVQPGDIQWNTEDGNYALPELSLLDEPEPLDRSAIEQLCREKAWVLENTLKEFRLEVQVVAIDTGPVITVFELKLAPGIKVSQIVTLSNDMARALKAPAVRVVAPLPGKNTIGIEVPNLDKEKVRIKDLMHRAGKRSGSFNIPLFLGKDAAGQPLVADLTKMPHMLIAGTTGSGKSVCVSSVILSVLMTRTPEEVNLILVDPKVVELAMFKDIPHLMCPIVTEMAKAEAILEWACTKMDERYELLAEAGVKDIKSYNKLGEAGLRERLQVEDDAELDDVPIFLPYMILVIDELADLMMTSAKEVEYHLCRLAQKSRAVGIHLIVSTQRPQANVVTGLIKSNLPSRIAFRVSSRLDSRIVLDQNGGEVLMGQGDMLFLPPGSSKLVRAQGTFISDEEIRAVVKHSREMGAPNYHPELLRVKKTDGEVSGERDELFDQAVDMIVQAGRGSVSLLQRKLTIGYGRASRLIDQMYEAGIVGEYKGSQAREVNLTKEEWDNLKHARDAEEASESADY